MSNSLIKSNFYPLFGVLSVFWVVELINLFTGHQLSGWGILPRTVKGLIGIPISPFLHHGIGHLLLNSVPFMVLGGFVILHGKKVFYELSLFIILAGGGALWLFGRTAYHAGASGLIFGYFGYLVGRGWYEKSLSAIIISLITLFLYGGILWGLLPIFPFVSWEGHLFGLIAGVLGAKLGKDEPVK